ncbi:Thiol:disulfide interchange protein TlpA [Novipirellula aureliae]|uniref:Thiol:disulfide interchange protein TlpA n=1 Tax=Novipirellula aureliae TaxID=2527966 RepID=A0A5C6EBR5_9BACT|nr:TlpA disulfide reductase family protein [Novipirellula aureliae]TWU44966.1 Thiol:disulfide interchange protein TlpA [Novipirellula aureliae]
MKKLNALRTFAAATAVVGLIAFASQPTNALDAAGSFGVGSDAPALDVEHWIQDGNGFFKPVTDFQDGKVYVVEFWATWCGPCIMSMPHLAELQNQYRGQNVQIVSISDESPEEVNEFLKQESDEEEKTFGEITSAYSLTTDPDRSAHADYMEASNAAGIPTAYIVGKTGKIEWIGHPMGMDETLEAVVNDKWDREAYKKQYEQEQRLQQAIEEISMLAGAGKFDDAIKRIEEEISKTDNEDLKTNLKDFRYSLMLSAGQINEEVVGYYKKQVEEMKDNPMALGQFGYSLVGVSQQGGKIGPLADLAIKNLAPVVDKAEAEVQPLLLNIMAQLSQIDKKLDQAIEYQEKAVEASGERQKQRMELYLDELKSEKESG